MNHLYEQLTALKLTGFRDALKKQLAQPGTYQELGFEERLSLLTAEELTCRENRKAERLIKHARFRLNAELSKLDYRNNRGLDRALIRSLSQGNWLSTFNCNGLPHKVTTVHVIKRQAPALQGAMYLLNTCLYLL